MKANVLRIKKYDFSIYYQQNFAFRYTPTINDVDLAVEMKKLPNSLYYNSCSYEFSPTWNSFTEALNNKYSKIFVRLFSSQDF